MAQQYVKHFIPKCMKKIDKEQFSIYLDIEVTRLGSAQPHRYLVGTKCSGGLPTCGCGFNFLHMHNFDDSLSDEHEEIDELADIEMCEVKILGKTLVAMGPL